MHRTNGPHEPWQLSPKPLTIKQFQLVPAAVAALGAAILFNLQNTIVPVIDSFDLCDTPAVIDISSWIFPKLVAHCDLITNTGLRNHPRAGVAILLDLYFVLVFLILFARFARTFARLSPENIAYA